MNWVAFQLNCYSLLKENKCSLITSVVSIEFINTRWLTSMTYILTKEIFYSINTIEKKQRKPFFQNIFIHYLNWIHRQSLISFEKLRSSKCFNYSGYLICSDAVQSRYFNNLSSFKNGGVQSDRVTSKYCFSKQKKNINGLRSLSLITAGTSSLAHMERTLVFFLI